MFTFSQLDFPRQKIEELITTASINKSLQFRTHKKLALISGAGIAGLAAAFELLAKDYNVVIAEKRESFSRFNIINLDVDVRRFLKKFNLLEAFEKNTAAKISEHKYLLHQSHCTQLIGASDVRALQESTIAFVPSLYSDLFTHEGVYSAKIKDLQNFLAEQVINAGARIFGNVEIERQDNQSLVCLKNKSGLSDSITIAPDLIFIAEGAHSATAQHLGMRLTETINACSNECWIFGNANYSGQDTFVVSVIDTTESTLKLANVIFNSRLKQVNIAVSAQFEMDKAHIEDRLLSTLNHVTESLHIQPSTRLLNQFSTNPVTSQNRQLTPCSKGKFYSLGDTAGHSSPLAGMGGTLGLTLIPACVKQLLTDIEHTPDHAQQNFEVSSAAYTNRWINKSVSVKNHCLTFFKDQTLSLNVDSQPTEPDELTSRVSP